LKNVHDGEQDVVEGVGAADGVAVELAGALNPFRLEVEAFLIGFAVNFNQVWSEQACFFSNQVVGHASLLEGSSKQLSCNCSEHDHHEQEQHHDVEHDGQ
jgi:hypothetical protein